VIKRLRNIGINYILFVKNNVLKENSTYSRKALSSINETRLSIRKRMLDDETKKGDGSRAYHVSESAVSISYRFRKLRALVSYSYGRKCVP
jgi:hypothetical protein